MTGDTQERVAESTPHSAARLVDPARPEEESASPSTAPAPDIPELVSFAAYSAFLAALTTLGVGLSLLPESQAVAFITKNDLPTDTRRILLLLLGVAAALPAAVTARLFFRNDFSQLTALRATVARLSPLAVLGVTPLVVHFRAFIDRELLFLTLASLSVLFFQKLLLRAQAAPPLAVEARARALVERVTSLPERVRSASPLAVVIVGAVGYAAFFGFHTVQNHYKLGTSAYDLGLEENILWNILHGGPLFKSSPLGGPEAIHFGYHATLFAFVLVPFYALYQHAETLLVIQALLIGAAAVPLFLFARRHVSAWPAALISLAYLMNPAVQGSNLYDFHYPPLAPFFVWLALYALEARKHVLAAVAIALTLSIREDIAAGVVVIGLYLFFWQRRVRAGLVVATVGAVYFVAMKLLIMPRVARESTFLWIFAELLPAGEGSYTGVLKTVFSNPAYTLSTLLVPKKLVYTLQIFAPLAFLPLRRSIGWLCAMPGVFFLLLSTGYEPTVSLGFQYPAHFTLYLFVAIVIILAEERESAPLEGVQRERSWLGALALGTLLGSHQFGVLFQQEVARAGFDRVEFGMNERDHERLADLREIVSRMPPDAKVAASERINPHVSNRADAYRLAGGTWDARYLLFDLRDLRDDEKAFVEPALRDKVFGVVARQGRFVLAERGARARGNRAVLRALR
jgi:uncharacterized membrane protein